jgi:hypothetical protein
MTTQHDERHGGPYDRGRADFWYGRQWRPHYFTGGTYTSPEIEGAELTEAELDAYRAGYADAEAQGDQKQWD